MLVLLVFLNQWRVPVAKTNKYKIMATTNPIFGASTQQADTETSSFETDHVVPVRSVDRVKSIEEDPNVATIFSCFVNLCNTILGSGLLGLPYGNILCSRRPQMNSNHPFIA